MRPGEKEQQVENLRLYSYKQNDYNLKGKKNPIKIREETLDNVSVIVTRYKSYFNSSLKYKVII